MKNFRPKSGRVIQFVHPGKEPPVSRTSNSWFCPLNRGEHKRKYIVAQGQYVLCNENFMVEHIYEDRLGFWGEWEHPSQAYRFGTTFSGGPQAWHVPLIEEEAGEYEGLPAVCTKENTFCHRAGGVSIDPFVFTPGFYYACCKIPRYPSLANLNPGDLVVFSSHVEKVNVFDTVFVVNERISLQEAWERSPLFKKTVGITALQHEGKPEVYVGQDAQPGQSVPFSFFPAMPFGNGSFPQRFKRPAIPDNLLGEQGFSAGNLQGIKIVNRSVDEVWTELAQTVINSGLIFGTGASVSTPTPSPHLNSSPLKKLKQFFTRKLIQRKKNG